MLSKVSDDWDAGDGDPIFTSMPSSRARIFKKRNDKLAAAFAHVVNGVEEVGYDKKIKQQQRTLNNSALWRCRNKRLLK